MSIILLFFTICLVIFSSSNLVAAKTGLNLWATSVVPSLFPFFVATELLLHTNLPFYMGKIFKNFMKPFFNIGGEGAFAMAMGLISGYPVGAKIACDFREKNILSKIECERLLSFTNNSRSIIYCWHCRNKHVWEYINWIFTFDYTHNGKSYCCFFI